MPERFEPFIIKLAGFLLGLFIGLAAKLATVNKRQKLSLKEILYHSCVAFAAAWAVWHLLVYWGKPDLATGASVIVGRFADDILIIIWQGIKTLIKKASNDLEK